MTARRTAGLILAALFTLGALGACGDGESETAPAEGEPDLRGIPDVVATVNDAEITKADFVAAYTAQFQQQQAQAGTTGQPVDEDALKQQTAEGLVNNELLLQEAAERDFDATEDDVQEMLADYAEQSGAESPEAYLETLAEQGLEEDLAREQLADQVRLDQLFADEGVEEPTETELRELYDAAVEQQKALSEGTEEEGAPEQEIPAFDEVRDQLADQARSQEQNEVAQALLETLREDAEIDIAL